VVWTTSDRNAERQWVGASTSKRNAESRPAAVAEAVTGLTDLQMRRSDRDSAGPMRKLVCTLTSVLVLASCGGQTVITPAAGTGGASALPDAGAGGPGTGAGGSGTGAGGSGTGAGGSGTGAGGSDAPAGGSGAVPEHVCKLNSDCAGALVCLLGLCHAQCAQTRDCPLNQRCVESAAGGVCQLATESACSHNSDCAAPLLCAKDLSCRNQCVTSRDCVAGQVCTVSMVCADPSELDASGDLPSR